MGQGNQDPGNGIARKGWKENAVMFDDDEINQIASEFDGFAIAIYIILTFLACLAAIGMASL